MQFVLIKVMVYCIIHIVLAEMTIPDSFGESQAVLINSINCNAANVAGKKSFIKKHKCNIATSHKFTPKLILQNDLSLQHVHILKYNFSFSFPDTLSKTANMVNIQNTQPKQQQTAECKEGKRNPKPTQLIMVPRTAEVATLVYCSLQGTNKSVI